MDVTGQWEAIDLDGVETHITYQGVTITASWPQRTRTGIDTNVRIDWTGPNPRLLLSTSRVNLLSTTAKHGLAATLKRADVGFDPDPLVHATAEHLIGIYRAGGTTSKPAPKPRKSGGWLIWPIWPAVGATGVAAAPGSYKSFTAQAIALQLATGAEVLAGNTRTPNTCPVLYLDWEGAEDTFAERSHALQTGMGLDPQPVLHYRHMRTPLVDAAGQVAEEIARNRIGAVIVDSMSAGISGGMVDDDVVNAFWSAVRQLGVPSLVIAHKSDENIRRKRARFFGSVMSEARVRMAWNVETTDQGQVVWECFKDNHGRSRGSKLAWQAIFDDEGLDEEAWLRSVSFQAISPTNVAVVPEGSTVSDRMRAVLADGPLPQDELALLVGASATTVRTTGNRDKHLFGRDTVGRWRLL
jgi:hypothetical protein